MGVVYSYDNLNEIQWFGDNLLTDFLEEWDNIIENLEIELTDEAKRDLLYKKMKNSKLFAADLKAFLRERSKSLEKGLDTEDYSLRFLLSIFKAQIKDE